MKPMAAAALFIVVVALAAPSTQACWCGGRDVAKSFTQAGAVFVGEVVEIIEPRTSDPAAPLPGRFFTIRFKVEKSWKGVPLAVHEFNVLAAQGRYGCFAYPAVRKGERYLVYADPAYSDGVEERTWTIITICNRTTLIQFTLHRPNAIDPYDDMKKLDAMAAFPPFRFDFKPALRSRPAPRVGG